MSFNFVIPEFNIGGTGTPTFQFYKRGFNLQGNGSTPSWQDIVLSGNGSLTLTNAKADSLSSLKLFGGIEQRNLPSGYTQVEYLGGTVNSYASLGEITIKPDDKIYCEFYVSPNGKRVFGMANRTRCYVAASGTGTCAFANKSFAVPLSYWNVDGTTINTVLMTQDKFVINGVSFTPTGTASDDICSNFSINEIYTATGGTAGSVSYIKKFYIQDVNGDYKFNLIPCKNSSNVLGMYDLVSNTFLTNQGEGTFTAGADVVPSPTTPMDIVCNNGAIKYGALGKNLFNPTKVLFGYYRDRTTGIKQQSSSNFMSSDDGYIPCLPNTTYTFVGTNKTNGTYSKYNTIYFFDSAKNYLGASPYDISQPTTGTTPNNCYYLQVRSNPLDNSTPIQDALEQFNWQLEQGSTATPYEPYRAGIYTDGTTETVEVHGKNLFNVNNVTIQANTAISSDGSLVTNSAVDTCMTYIAVKPNTTYTISGDVLGTSSAFFRLAQYKTDKTFISRSEDSTGERSSYTFTTGTNTYYIRFHYVRSASLNTYQLELGSTATTYELYFNGGSATAEMLLKVGDYQDIQSVLDGEVTRKVGIKVLDGTETGWTKLSSTNYVSLPKTAISGIVSGTDVTCLLSHFIQIAHSAMSQNTDCFSVGASYINFKKDDDPTVAQFKQFLADQYNSGNPVVIVYPLATATTETVTGQPLTIQEGTNILEITQASINNLGLEVSYKGTV